MNIFQRPNYESDITLFLKSLKKEKPGLRQSQLQGRALLWDKSVDREAWSEFKAARVAQKPYVYQTLPQTDPKA
ncbi:MAG: DUF3460 family protein [Rhodoferax sp.]